MFSANCKRFSYHSFGIQCCHLVTCVSRYMTRMVPSCTTFIYPILVFLCPNYYNFKTSKNNIEGYFILKVDVMEKYLYFFLMFLFCVCGFVDFISLMIFGCTCSYNMSASERWIFEMKEGLKNKRITKK